jgi:hypothetical protein
MGHQDTGGQRAQQLVVVAVPAACLVADLESVGQAFQDLRHLISRLHFCTAHHLSCLAEHAHRDALHMDIESDVQHDCDLQSQDSKN